MLPLWQLYLEYVKKIYNTTSQEDLLALEEVYCYILDTYGQCADSLQLWQEYIKFLENIPAYTPQDESEKINRIRQTYQRAVVLPIRDNDI